MLKIILCFSLFSFVGVLKPKYKEIGRASYYSDKFEGKKTSSGEIFKQKLMTGAHKTLSFGTIVKITNLSNNEHVKVKINDRLSPKSSSIIDVTTKVAKKLDFIKDGHTQVQIEIVE
jgi:rare lipoprotein A